MCDISKQYKHNKSLSGYIFTRAYLLSFFFDVLGQIINFSDDIGLKIFGYYLVLTCQIIYFAQHRLERFTRAISMYIKNKLIWIIIKLDYILKIIITSITIGNQWLFCKKKMTLLFIYLYIYYKDAFFCYNTYRSYRVLELLILL